MESPTPTTMTDDESKNETESDSGHLDRALATDGPAAALTLLTRSLEANGQYRALLDAYLLQARLELGLPLIARTGLQDIPAESRPAFEERYIHALRTVGTKLLDAGRIPDAWPYFRLLGEHEPIAKAIDAFDIHAPNARNNPDLASARMGNPLGATDESPDVLGQLIEIAFHQGAHPQRGFALILECYGICSAITAFEHLPNEPAIRRTCAEMLVKQLNNHLIQNLRGEISRRGQLSPPDSTPVPALLQDRDWLFIDDSYHIDVSHLAAVTRLCALSDDAGTLALGRDLCDYGQRLSRMHRYDGDPPFEDTYVDHGIYFRGLLGETDEDVDTALKHFREKLDRIQNAEAQELEGNPEYLLVLTAQVLIRILVRRERWSEAFELARTYLARVPESVLSVPTIPQLAARAGAWDQWADFARTRGELVAYLTARLAQKDVSTALSPQN